MKRIGEMKERKEKKQLQGSSRTRSFSVMMDGTTTWRTVNGDPPGADCTGMLHRITRTACTR